MTGSAHPSPDEIRERAIATGMQLFISVRPDACPVCGMNRSKIYWADEAPILPHSGCLKDECHCEYRVFDHHGPTLAEMLAKGIAAAKASKMDEAQEWLVGLLQIDRYNEQAWLWLSGTADNDQDRLDCMREILKINPDNALAQRGLAALRSKGVQLDDASVPPIE